MTDSAQPIAIATLADLFGKTPKRRFKTTDPLPVLGIPVRIRSLFEDEVAKYQAAVIGTSGSQLKKARLEDANRRLIALCVVDANGNPMMTGEHIAKLAGWDAADTQFLYDECSRHCGLNKGDLEDLVKNSAGTTVVD